MRSLERIDRYTRAARPFWNLNRWVAIRVDAIGALFAAALAFYLVYIQNRTAANIGFLLDQAGGFTRLIQRSLLLFSHTYSFFPVGFNMMILYWVRIFNDFEVEGECSI